jgi:mRNA-degrading endonuclease RelE of RelBE toxin-antitoxin system
VTTHSKKIIVGLQPTWEHVEPIWQMRVQDFRVFYDVDEVRGEVVVRAIRYKPPHKTTEEIL